MAEIQRNYAMMRLAAGDYLLPANDDRTLLRIRRGREENFGEDGQLVDAGEWWQAWRWREARLPLTEHEAAHLAESTMTFEGWELIESYLRTRDEAIQAALRIHH